MKREIALSFQAVQGAPTNQRIQHQGQQKDAKALSNVEGDCAMTVAILSG